MLTEVVLLYNVVGSGLLVLAAEGQQAQLLHEKQELQSQKLQHSENRQKSMDRRHCCRPIVVEL